METVNGVNSGVSGLDWSKPLTNLAQSVGCEGVEVSGAIINGEVSLTMKETATGKMASTTFQPVLDPAELDEDMDFEAAKKVVADKLLELDGELKGTMLETFNDICDAGDAGLIDEDSTGYSKAMFNVYDLIRLIQECAQQQKEVARDIREADLQASLAATHAEAEAQRQAALKGMVITIALSGLAAIGSFALGFVGMRKTYNVAKKRMDGQIGRAQSNRSTILKGSSEKKAEVQRKKVQKELKKGEKEEVDKLFAEKDADVPKTAEGNKAQTSEGNKAQAAEDNKAQNAEGNKAQNAEGNKAQTADKNIVNNELDNSKSDAKASETKQKVDQNKETQGKQKDDNEIIEDRKSGENVDGKDVQKDKSDVEQAADAKNESQADIKRLETKQAKLEQDTDEAFAELDDAKLEGDSGKINAAKSKVDSCLRKEKYGRAVLTHEKSKKKMTASLKSDLNKANDRLEKASGENNNSLELAKAESSAGNWNVASGSAMMMGNAIGGVGGSVQQMEMAKATEIDAEVKEADTRREEANEVFSAAQDLINNVLDLYRQVIQSESQSTDRIIQA